MSDRDKGLLGAQEQRGTAEWVEMCAKHLSENFAMFGKAVKDLVLCIACAYSEDLHNHLFGTFRDLCPLAFDKLQQLDPNLWAVCFKSEASRGRASSQVRPLLHMPLQLFMSYPHRSWLKV